MVATTERRNRNYFISFDPGKTTGYATFSESGELTACGNIPDGLEGLSLFLAALEDIPRVVICETYKIRPWVPHNFSKVETIREVGVIQEYALRHNAEFVEQETAAKNAGRLWGSIKPDKNKLDSHHKDALGHGIYYLHKKGLWEIKVPGDEES